MWATCLTDFALFQACRCRICARHTTFAWIRQQHQHQPRGTAAFTNWMLTHVDDTLEAYLSKGHTESVLSAVDSLALESRRELPTGCAPTMQDVPHALSGLALHWHGLDMCIDVLVTIDCLPCTSKLLQSKITDNMINDQLAVPTNNWPNAKVHLGEYRQLGHVISCLPDAFHQCNL